VPDLTFSEMGFLANRRYKSKEQNDNLTKGRREKGKAAGDEDEISKFFSAGKQVLAEREINRQDKAREEAAYPYGKAHGHAKRAVSRRSNQRQSPYAPIELPEKPFLGFGNRGAHPFPSLESQGPMGKAAPSAAPSEVTQRTPSLSTTDDTWSSSSIESNSTRPRQPEDIVRPLGFPVVSAASNPAAPSVEVGQLCPDTQTILSHEKPRPSSSSAESTHPLQPKTAAHPPHSQPVVDASLPTEAGKACHDPNKQHEPVKNKDGEREQQPADMKVTLTTDTGHDVHVIPNDAGRSAVQRHEPEKQVQYLESLLDACKTTLSGLAKIGYDTPTSRATKPPEQPDSVGLPEALSILNAGITKQTQLSQGRPAQAESEEQKTLPGGSGEDITRSPKQRAAKPPNLMGLSEDVSSKGLEDVSGADPIEGRTRQPLPSNCGVHTEHRAPRNAATAFDHRIAGRQSLELQHTRTPLAGPRLSNPHQSPRFAYVNANPQQGSGRLYAFEHAREGHSTDWLGFSRHTPLGPGAFSLPDPNYAVGDSQLRTAYGTSHTRPVHSQDMDFAPQNVQADDNFLGDRESQPGDHRDSPRYRHQTMSPADHHRGHISWLDESTDETRQTDMQEQVLEEEAMDSHEVGIEKDVNHLAPSDTDEGPMTRFWRPHRLY